MWDDRRRGTSACCASHGKKDAVHLKKGGLRNNQRLVNPEKGGRQGPLSDWKLPEGSGARLVKLKETGPVFSSKQLDKGREKPCYLLPKSRWKFAFRAAFPKSHCNNFSIKKE